MYRHVPSTTLQVARQSSCVRKLFLLPRQPPYEKGTHMAFGATNAQRRYIPRHGPTSGSSMHTPADHTQTRAGSSSIRANCTFTSALQVGESKALSVWPGQDEQKQINNGLTRVEVSLFIRLLPRLNLIILIPRAVKEINARLNSYLARRRLNFNVVCLSYTLLHAVCLEMWSSFWFARAAAPPPAAPTGEQAPCANDQLCATQRWSLHISRNVAIWRVMFV